MNDIRERLTQAVKDGTLTSVLEGYLNGKYQEIQDVGQELVLLSNSKLLNFCETIIELDKQDKRRNLILTRMFEKALPQLELPLPDILSCIDNLSEDESDGAHFELFDPLVDYCSKQESRPKELFDIALSKVEFNVKFFKISLISWSKIDIDEAVTRSLEFVSDSSDEKLIAAIQVLGSFEYQENTVLSSQVFRGLQKVASVNDDVIASLIRALFNLQKLDAGLEIEFIEYVKKYVTTDTPQSHFQTALIFQSHCDNLPSTVFEALLKTFGFIDPDNGRAITQLDLGMAYLIENDRLIDALEIIENLLSRTDRNLSINSFYKIVTMAHESSELMSIVITRWLGSKTWRLGRAAMDLVEREVDSITILSVDHKQITEDVSRELLAKKACGWFYTAPISAVSFIVTLFQGATTEEAKQLKGILFNPLLISYPSKVKKYLLELVTDAKSLVEELCQQLERYHEGLNKSAGIKELSVSESQKEAYYRKLNEKTVESFEKAKSGMLTEILGIKKSVVLYGEGTIFRTYRGEDESPIRQETKFQTFSTSMEFPAIESVDPHGLNMMIESFRLEGCIK